MVCRNCGNQIDEGDRFCQVCGQPVAPHTRKQQVPKTLAHDAQPVYYQQKPAGPDQSMRYQQNVAGPKRNPAKKGLSPALTFVLGIVLVAALAAGLFFGDVISFGKTDSKGRSVKLEDSDLQENNVKVNELASQEGRMKAAADGFLPGSGKIEGNGFDTPEEAVIAYVEALKEQDLEKMISTFAVETYCENYDTAAYIRSVAGYAPGLFYSSPFSPSTNQLMKDRNILTRQSQIMSWLNDQFQAFVASNQIPGSADADLLTERIGSFHVIDQGSEADHIVSVLQSLPDLSSIEIGDVVYAEEMTKLYLTYVNLRNEKQAADIQGADGFKSLGLTFSINGQQYLVTMDTMRYGDRWYNIVVKGNVGELMGLPSQFGGLAFGDTLDAVSFQSIDSSLKAEIKEGWEEAHQEYMAEYTEELKESGLSEEDFNKELDRQLKQEREEKPNALDKRTSIEAFDSFEDFLDYFALTELS